MMSAQVLVEIWPLAADEHGLWLVSGRDAWRPPLPLSADTTVQAEVSMELARQELARQALTPPPSGPTDGGVLPDRPRDGEVLLHHSTSWRQDGPAIVITWVVVMACTGPVRGVWPHALPVGLGVARTVGPPEWHAANEVPTPRRADVLLHALRHLRFLLDTDASARAALNGHWVRHLGELSPVLATLYEEGDTPTRAA